MDRRRVIAMMILYRRIKRKRRNRIMWIHPINMARKKFGAFYILFGQLREDAKKFFNYFRMSMSSFDELHQRLKESLQKQDTFMRECIQPIEMLSVTIR